MCRHSRREIGLLRATKRNPHAHALLAGTSLLAVSASVVTAASTTINYSGSIVDGVVQKARPYIWRLMVFSRLICPSVCPLLQSSVTAARTAS